MDETARAISLLGAIQVEAVVVAIEGLEEAVRWGVIVHTIWMCLLFIAVARKR